MKWEDITSYSRSDNKRIPRVTKIEIRDLKIIIHRVIHLESWYLTCYKLDIEDKSLDTDDLDVAKKEGVQLIIKNIELLEEIKDELISIVH